MDNIKECIKNVKLIILDNLLLYKGIIDENYVGTQLIANQNLLIYWESGNKAEVDFVLYNDDGIILHLINIKYMI